MKSLIITTLFLTFNLFYGQVAIGKDTVDGDGILDFGIAKKGIILPYTGTLVGSVVAGTFVFDTTSKMVRYYNGTDWIQMNETGGSYSAYPTALREVGAGTILGAASSSAPGVLILEATDKSLVLPKVADPHTNILSPAAGTMCYDTTSKSVAVFNGTEWSYWK
ncbi:MAG: hypothetical protein ACK5MD_09010 [Flavobacteriales bacterium]